jgi:hypothetical protein
MAYWCNWLHKQLTEVYKVLCILIPTHFSILAPLLSPSLVCFRCTAFFLCLVSLGLLSLWNFAFNRFSVYNTFHQIFIVILYSSLEPQQSLSLLHFHLLDAASRDLSLLRYLFIFELLGLLGKSAWPPLHSTDMKEIEHQTSEGHIITCYVWSDPKETQLSLTLRMC